VSFIDKLLASAKKNLCLLLLSCVLSACSTITNKSEFVNQNEVNKNRLNADKDNINLDNSSQNIYTDALVEATKNSAKSLSPEVIIPSEASKDYAAALVFIDNKDWSKAIAKLKNISIQHPTLQGAGVALGWVYWQSGDKAAAVAQLHATIDANKISRADAYNYLAIINREQGQFENAEALYKKALVRWPNDPVLFENLGVLYELYLGRLEDALAAYKQAQAIKGGTDKKLKGWIKLLSRRTS
jgi:tetratricopeptide (TPR) repeat protein